MSNTILEAMASSIPIVATAVGGNAEIVVDGESGLLVQPSDSESLANAVLKLLEDERLRQKMGELGCQRVKEHFSLEAMTRNYTRFYLEVFSKRFQLSQDLQAKIYKKGLAI
jgi:glycosyltransferase involved in cell wall biosynthesis